MAYRSIKICQYISIILAVTALLLGGAALVERVADFSVIKTALSTFKMKVNTAIIVMGCGLAVLFLHINLNRVAAVLSFIIFTSICLILAEHIWQIDLGIDHWLYMDTQVNPVSEFPGRVSFLAAITSFLLSIGFILMSFNRHTVAQILAAITFTLVYASLISYLYTTTGLYKSDSYTGIRFNVAFSLLLLSISVLLNYPTHGWMALVYSKLSDQRMSVYILCYFLCIIPVLVALYLFIIGQTEFSKASGILVLLVVISISSVPIAYLFLARLKKLDSNLKKVNEQLTIAIHAASMGIWDLDVASGIISRSERQAELLGQAYTDTISEQSFFDQIFVEDRERVQRQFAAARENVKMEVQARIVIPDRQIRWVQIWGETKFDGAGEPIRIMGIMKDITNRKELEQHKDEFVSTVSHELKTPLTSIKAQTQILERKFSKSADVATAMMLKRINLQISRLNTIIKDLLEVGQIEEKKVVLRKELYYFTEMVKETVAEIQRTTTTHQLIIEDDKEIECIGDKERTCQVLSNLINNAIKYSPGGEKVIVTFNKQEDEICCSVQDFGLGIEPEKQAHIFDRYYRVNYGNGKMISGFGLGLYISYQIIKRLGGKIGLNSLPGKGSVFYFSVPAV